MKLTAAGKPFGEAHVEVPEGMVDFIWKKVRESLKGSKELADVRLATALAGVPRHIARSVMREIVLEALPEFVGEKDVERYTSELVEMIYK